MNITLMYILDVKVKDLIYEMLFFYSLFNNHYKILAVFRECLKLKHWRALDYVGFGLFFFPEEHD